MMADLQNIAPKPGMVPQERLLGRLLRISHQQDGSAAGLKQSDQRAVIYLVSRDILRRTEERERSAALQRERLAVIRDEGRESAPAERRGLLSAWDRKTTAERSGFLGTVSAVCF